MQFTIIMLFALVPVVGAMEVFVPWLMPETECLTVTVPHGERKKEPLKGLMRAYAVRTAIVSVICMVISLVAFALLDLDLTSERGAGLFAAVYTFALCAPMVASFVLMLHYRRLVQDVKREKGWTADNPRSVAFVGPEDFPRPISVLWNLLFIPLIAGMVVFALANYDRFPEMIPMHTDFNGVVNDYAPKSVGTVLFPALVTAFLGVVFAATHVGMVRSKKPIDPDAPASSALAYGRFARAQSIVMLIGGLALSATTGILFYASTLGAISLQTVSTIEIAVALVWVAALIAVSVRSGQAGGRFATAAPDGSMARDDDAFWKLGIFYVNPDDPSIMVPKRFGVGWTVNFGRPATWLVIVVFIVVTVAFAWGSIVIAN